MSPTVHALRNEIRLAVGRYERLESTSFTKESLAAICEAVDADIDGPRPSKPERRRAILRAVGAAEPGDDAGESAFRKAELQAIADALRDEDERAD